MIPENAPQNATTETAAAPPEQPESFSLSYDQLQRHDPHSPASPIDGKKQEAAKPGDPARPAPAARPPSRAREMLSVSQRERQLAEREARVAEAEERFLGPEERNARAWQSQQRDATEFLKVHAEDYPTVASIPDLADMVPRARIDYWRRTGKLLSFEQVADAIESTFGPLAESAADARRRSGRFTPRAAANGTGAQTGDTTRRISERERFERALRVMGEAMARRNG